MKRIVLLLASTVLAMLIAVGLVSVVWEERARAAFPGTNGKIVFDRSGRNGGIYAVSFAGRNLKRLAANTRGVSNYDPAWSADGKKIVFVKERSGNSDIYTMNANGSNKKLVTNERSIRGRPADDRGPGFSPSGRKIVFERVTNTSEDEGDIYTIRVNGKKLTRLTRSYNYEADPAWSPRGNKIAFEQQDEDEYVRHVVTMNPDGSRLRYVSLDREGHSPDWSPDGSQLVTKDVGGIYKIKANGAGMTRLTSPRNARHSDPAFSPGRGKIVFSSNRDGDYDLYMMDADGTDVKRITNLPGDEFNPNWQPLR